jgi:hypothetical protein
MTPGFTGRQRVGVRWAGGRCIGRGRWSVPGRGQLFLRLGQERSRRSTLARHYADVELTVTAALTEGERPAVGRPDRIALGNLIGGRELDPLGAVGCN